jgi:hypothetical protein
VLPALVPELTYDGMAVANGQDAGLAWKSWRTGSVRARADKEGPAEILQAGHTGIGEAARHDDAERSRSAVRTTNPRIVPVEDGSYGEVA